MIQRDNSHVYRKDGKILLSVTQHLQITGLVDFSHINPYTLAFAAQRGSFVHRAHYLYLLDDLDIDSLDESYKAYCEAFIKFYKEQDIEVWDSENILHSDKLMTAGSFDMVGKFNGIGSVVEFKTSTTMPKTTGLQLSGYKTLWNESKPDNIVVNRWGVHLLKTGKYKLYKYDDRKDESVFRNIADVNWWALSNGIIPTPAKANPQILNLCQQIIGG